MLLPVPKLYVGFALAFASTNVQATGVVAAGYGVGALLTTFPIASVLRESTYQDALTRFGVLFAVVGLIAAQGLRRPSGASQIAWNQQARAAGASSTVPIHLSPLEMLGSHQLPHVCKGLWGMPATGWGVRRHRMPKPVRAASP